MSVLQFAKFNEARSHFKELLDAAEQGRPAVVRRHNHSTALIDRDRFRHHLMALNADRIQLVPDGDGWLAVVRDAPIAAEGEDAEGAVDELIDALREYSDDWSERLRLASNHQINWGLVQFVDLSTDDELRDWILGR